MATQAKKELRKQIKGSLSALADEAVSLQSKTAEDIIISLPEYKAAQRVGIYLSMPTGEAQTELLVTNALSSGKAVFVPYLYSTQKPGPDSSKRKVMDMLRLNSLDEYRGLARDAWGIPKLPAQTVADRECATGGKGVSLDVDGLEKNDREVGGLDLIVMPAVAFDRSMNRLGHGAGFYDNFLERFCRDGSRKKPFLVGLCLAEQLLPPGQQLVIQDWDWKVDAVAVGDGSFVT